MTPKSKPDASLSPSAYAELEKLPGNLRRQMIKTIDQLSTNPRPPNSKPLKLEEIPQEIRRVRLGKWRIIYFILDEQPVILGIRRRPPYDYDDLEFLTQDHD